MSFKSCLPIFSPSTVKPGGYLLCKGDTLDLECDAGKIIQVTSAIYGRQTASVCPGNHRNLNCAAPNSLAVVQGLCEGKQSCQVAASGKLFPDPCRGTDKYLHLTYSCIVGKCTQLDSCYICQLVTLEFPQ